MLGNICRTCDCGCPGYPVVASSRAFPVCREPMTDRNTSAGSDTCRAAKSRRRRVAEQLARDDGVPALLQAVLRVVAGGDDGGGGEEAWR